MVLPYMFSTFTKAHPMLSGVVAMEMSTTWNGCQMFVSWCSSGSRGGGMGMEPYYACLLWMVVKIRGCL